jgi:hypothetical protein
LDIIKNAAMKRLILLLILFLPVLAYSQTQRDTVKVKPFDSLTVVTRSTIDTADQLLIYDSQTNTFAFRGTVGELLRVADTTFLAARVWVNENEVTFKDSLAGSNYTADGGDLWDFRVINTDQTVLNSENTMQFSSDNAGINLIATTGTLYLQADKYRMLGLDDIESDHDTISRVLVKTTESDTLKGVPLSEMYFFLEDDSLKVNSASLAFDSDRQILRVPTAGTNIGGSTITEWLEWWYFTAPTISMSISPSTTVYENGDSAQIIGTATTTNSGGATLSNGSFVVSWSGGSESKSYGAATSAKDTIQFAPIQGSSTNYNRTQYSFSASQNWVFGSDSGTANSNTRTVNGVYPVLYGVSATDYSASGNIYGAAGFSKLVQSEGNKSVTFTGTGFLYYAVPTTWSDTSMSVIYDHNGFDVTSSFTVYDVTVSSSGLTNNWSGVSYKLYKLNSATTASGFTYQFNR